MLVHKRLVVLVFITLQAMSQTLSGALVTYDFSGSPGNQLATAPASSDAWLIATGLVRGTGLTAAAAANSMNSSGRSDLSSNDYLAFGFTVADGHKANLTTLKFTGQASASGPGELALRMSRDGYTTNLATWLHEGTAPVNVSMDLSGLGDITAAFELHIVAAGNLSAGGGVVSNSGTWRIGSMASPGLTNLLVLDGSTAELQSVPEPGSGLLILAVGVGALLGRRKPLRFCQSRALC
jgi:hypothetical protein